VLQSKCCVHSDYPCYPRASFHTHNIVFRSVMIHQYFFGRNRDYHSGRNFALPYAHQIAGTRLLFPSKRPTQKIKFETTLYNGKEHKDTRNRPSQMPPQHPLFVSISLLLTPQIPLVPRIYLVSSQRLVPVSLLSTS